MTDRGARGRRATGPLWTGLMIAALLAAGPALSRAGAECPPEEAAAAPESVAVGFATAAGTDVVCYPAVISAGEGNWTFLLRGGDAYKVNAVRLIAADTEVAARRLTYPTPGAALADFTYAPLAAQTSVHLAARYASGAEAVYEIRVEPATVPPPDRRQPDRVRVQLQPWTLVYPLHGFGRDGGIKGRGLQELSGDEGFLRLLADLDIKQVRKVLASYAEEDSVHWDERNQRELIYGGTHLRQYLMMIDPERSEAAYMEIFFAFPQVEAAFVNENSGGSTGD